MQVLWFIRPDRCSSYTGLAQRRVGGLHSSCDAEESLIEQKQCVAARSKLEASLKAFQRRLSDAQ